MLKQILRYKYFSKMATQGRFNMIRQTILWRPSSLPKIHFSMAVQQNVEY